MNSLLIELALYWPAPIIGVLSLLWWAREYSQMPPPRPRSARWMLVWRFGLCVAACVLYASVILRVTQDGSLIPHQGLVLRGSLAAGIAIAQIADLLWIVRREAR